MSRPPIIGNATDRQCARWTGGTFGGEDMETCKEDSTHHLVVDGYWASFVCREHYDEYVQRWEFWKAHPVGHDCGMPGSRFYPEENVCRYESDELPVREREREIVRS